MYKRRMLSLGEVTLILEKVESSKFGEEVLPGVTEMEIGNQAIEISDIVMKKFDQDAELFFRTALMSTTSPVNVVHISPDFSKDYTVAAPGNHYTTIIALNDITIEFDNGALEVLLAGDGITYNTNILERITSFLDGGSNLIHCHHISMFEDQFIRELFTNVASAHKQLVEEGDERYKFAVLKLGKVLAAIRNRYDISVWPKRLK